MKQNFLPNIAIVALLLTLAGSQLRAVAKEPTIDDRFRDTGNKTSEGELPLLTPPQSKLVRENPNGDAISGPAYLGVTFGDNDRNAVVRTVAPGSPAEQAGLKSGDVIETLQGITIDSPEDVLKIVAKMRPGTMLDVGVSRRISLHAQAPLSVLPGATTRTVGYPPDPTSSGYNATANSPHELIPVPSNVQRNSAKTMPQSNRNTASQRPTASSSSQRRSNSQNSNQSDGNRGLLGRRR
jgi:membrane-associated protease RseP (regulator of RpoE activity)